MKNRGYVYFLSIVAALGGFLFGFDTAVISGAERAIQVNWNLSDWYHGLAVAIALYGTVLGALFGGLPSDLYGRKKVLLWIGVLYFISALGSAMATEVYSFMLFRFLGGLGVGASSVVAPMYISEIAPAKDRGKLVALYQFNIVFGILMAYFSNYLIGITITIDAWRYMLGVEAIPALIYTLLVFKVPESPRWMVLKKGNTAVALEILTKTDPEAAEEIISRAKSESLQQQNSLSFFSLFRKEHLNISLMAVAIAVFNQVSGINAIIYFAPRIFEMAGIATESALLSTIGIGVVNLICTMLGLLLIDRMGRRFLMLVGSAGYIVSLTLMALSFQGEYFPSGWLPIFVFIFIGAHAIGQGSVIWVFISEIFPNKLRAKGQSLGSFTHWILAALIANIFPFLAGKFGPTLIFSFFGLMMVVQLLWVLFVMPETKGKSLEEIKV
ncbi:sugar porter family MFS transporter [Litoribacter ruber]|uniref:sugar porter family MFS transporter n=1 Tax=Litoribacter ruber TaxID=702568 RepID=UPI001BD9DDA8|nr:sugar porter family MFS transporter [Litoribacter ruber]MBT0810927.1 sugar porter family MFS transporter [Litoribacter ruber]